MNYVYDYKSGKDYQQFVKNVKGKRPIYDATFNLDLVQGAVDSPISYKEEPPAEELKRYLNEPFDGYGSYPTTRLQELVNDIFGYSGNFDGHFIVSTETNIYNNKYSITVRSAPKPVNNTWPSSNWLKEELKYLNFDDTCYEGSYDNECYFMYNGTVWEIRPQVVQIKQVKSDPYLSK